MLRGSARHDGIPNKQSAKDPDRDKQREQQRNERAQMLPDDKEIHAGSQDLFGEPVKVKPSIEDSTSLQIRNSLGNFEPIRRYIENPFPATQPPQPLVVGGGERVYLPISAPSLRNTCQSVDNPVQNRPAAAPGISVPNSFPSDSNNTKSHYQRNLYQHVNHQTTGVISNNINPTTSSVPGTSNSGIGPIVGVSTTNFRASNQNHLIPLISKVPHNQPQLPLNSTTVFYSNSNQIPPVPIIVPTLGPISGKSPILTTSDNFQVKSKPIPSSFGLIESSASVKVKVEGASGLPTETFSTVFNTEPFLSNSNNSVRDAKCNKNLLPNKKPAPERADSQLELESILKEMTDVIPPLTAIQTPVKEINRKLPLRRSSKSEEKIVQSIIDSGMAKIPSPVPRMDSSGESSSSYESDSDSESEDSASSASQTEGNKSDTLGSNLASTTGSPTTKWNLSSFLNTAKDTPPIIGKLISKSPKDIKFNAFGSLDSEIALNDLSVINFDRPEAVTSTVANKLQSPNPIIENASTSSALETRAKVAARTTRGTSSRPAEQTPPITISSKGPTQSKDKVSSLSASSSEDEAPGPAAKQPKRKMPAKATTPEDKKPPTPGPGSSKRSRTSTQTLAPAPVRHVTKISDGESSPENKPVRNAKNGQDKNKTDTIRKLFRFGTNKPGGKVQSPNFEESNKSSTPPGPSKQTSNRVSSKGNPSVAYNGDLGTSANVSDNKKKESSKEKAPSQSQSKKQKLSGSALAKSLLLAHTIPETLVTVPCLPPSTRGVKEENLKNMSSSASSLIVRIPLDKLRRKPPLAILFPALAPIVSPSLSKTEKELEKANKLKLAANTATDQYRVPKVSQNSSRVGSSSDHPVIHPFPLHDTGGVTHDRDNSLCSDSGRISPTNHSNKKRPKKKSRTSPKKTKVKREREPLDSHIKIEVDFTDGEVSSANLLGYAVCDSITKTPPIDPDLVQAPDSSLNPPHLPSPMVQPQLQYLSYFEKNEIKDDLLSRDQDSYLEEAKKLKHSADHERTSTTQASMYLEAGLYFILTGIIMERDGTGNTAPYTMYRDTLTLIQYIGNRWRSTARSAGPAELQNQEAKIITLSMRCQALLFCKLFKMKMKEARDMVSNMHEYFTKNVVREPLIVNSPQLSTPSPHSPTSSPAGSSGVLQHTPSPHHHPQQNHLLPIPRNLYNQIQKQCGNTYNCIMAHDTWEQADIYVTRYHLEEFFIGVDRHLGPLTLHSTLVDLVRYVRHGLQLIKDS